MLLAWRQERRDEKFRQTLRADTSVVVLTIDVVHGTVSDTSDETCDEVVLENHEVLVGDGFLFFSLVTEPPAHVFHGRLITLYNTDVRPKGVKGAGWSFGFEKMSLEPGRSLRVDCHLPTDGCTTHSEGKHSRFTFRGIFKGAQGATVLHKLGLTSGAQTEEAGRGGVST